MTAVVAVGAVSALGRGLSAYRLEDPGEPPRRAIAEDPVLAAAGLARPRLARAMPELGVASGDRAADLLGCAFDQLIAELDARDRGWRHGRVGVCVGTSSGGMIAAERLFRLRHEGRTPSREEALSATYHAPLDRVLERCGLRPVKRCQLVAACASSTLAIGLATRWLRRGACDLVIAGGYDAVALFVAAGFEALRATSASLPRPFRAGRDGMCLGEGAALVALERGEPRAARFFVTGFGAAADAVHITAPDRQGRGLLRAARAALGEAGLDAAGIGLVSAHGSATPFNDAAEAAAIRELCGDPTPPVHPFKAQIGHTLGAAGVLEALALGDGLERGVVPAAAGEGPLDPAARVTLLARAERREIDAGLKLSAAFGGVTAALVVARRPSRRPPVPRPVCLVGHAAVASVDRPALAAATGLSADKIARLDELGRLTLAAVAELAHQLGRAALDGAGVVSGHALATLDTNERFFARLLDKGPRWVDPRLFPATSPNAAAGHCAIAFGLLGPNFAVNGGLDGGREALAAGAELCAAGDAERMIVVAADDLGPAARQWLDLVCPERPRARGAVALLLEAGAGGRQVDLDLAPRHHAGPVGHLALIDWLHAE